MGLWLTMFAVPTASVNDLHFALHNHVQFTHTQAHLLWQWNWWTGKMLQLSAL